MATTIYTKFAPSVDIHHFFPLDSYPMSFIWKQQEAEAKAQEIPLRRAAAFAFLTKVLGVVAVLKAVPYFLDLIQGDPSPPPPTTQTLPPLSLPPSPSV